MTIFREIGRLLIAGLLYAIPALAMAAPEPIEVAAQTLVRARQAGLQAGRDGSHRQQSVRKVFHRQVLYDGSVPGQIPENRAEELLPASTDPRI
jgi:hypothetical protein